MDKWQFNSNNGEVVIPGESIVWPTGPGYEDISGPVSEYNHSEWLWVNNPEFVVKVGKLFGNHPIFLTSSSEDGNGEYEPAMWQDFIDLPQTHISEFFFGFPPYQGVDGAYLCGYVGRVEDQTFMVVGLGEPMCSALSGTLICAGDTKIFNKYGWS